MSGTKHIVYRFKGTRDGLDRTVIRLRHLQEFLNSLPDTLSNNAVRAEEFEGLLTLVEIHQPLDVGEGS